MSRTTFVHSFGENGLFEQIGSPKSKVALKPALLIGRDATTGEWVKATNVAGSVIRAISVVKEGAIARPGEAYVSNPDRDMAIGAPQTADKFFLLEVPKNTYTLQLLLSCISNLCRKIFIVRPLTCVEMQGVHDILISLDWAVCNFI